jgi:hypothetical protein
VATGEGGKQTRGDYERSVQAYRDHLGEHPELAERARRELRGRDLACWCRRKTWPCHADVLLEIANIALQSIVMMRFPGKARPWEALPTNDLQ